MPLWNRRSVIKASAALGAVSLGRSARGAEQAAKQPNILFIMADDLGYADVSCYGRRDYQTPAIDGLATQGVQLMQAYANSCVCSPTRTALITGRYQYRLPIGLHEPLEGDGDGALPKGHPTLPSLLKQAGYYTSLVGKWHLGGRPDSHPSLHGYESFYGINGGGADYFNHGDDACVRRASQLMDQDQPAGDDGYLTDLFANRAVREIEKSAKSGRPFLISLYFNAPHSPWEGPDDKQTSAEERKMRYRPGESGNLKVFAEMVTSMDRNIGRVLATLKERGFEENTIVVFTSDNGGDRFSDMWPHTGHKGELFEGGIRVPAIVRWPGRIKANTRSEQTCISMDWMPTLLAAAGSKPDSKYPSDGVNLLPQLTGAAAVARKLYWRRNASRFEAEGQQALRDGDWKYLHKGDRDFLFNLAEDVREQANRERFEPQRLAAMKADYAAWNSSMLPYPEGVKPQRGMQGPPPGCESGQRKT